MPKFRNKPIEIEAVQLGWKSWNDVCAFLGDVISPENPARYMPEGESPPDTCGEKPPYIELTVQTMHGPAVVKHGDWIAREPTPGQFYPINPKVFAATYDPV